MRGLGACRAGLAAFCLAVALVPVAQADDLPVAILRYDASPVGDACPDEQSLRDLVLARMGRDPFTSDPQHEEAAVVVTRIVEDDQGLTGSVELIGPDGEQIGLREISAAGGECEELLSALSVAISIALDPASSPLQLDREDPSADDQQPSPSPPPIAAEADEEAPPSPVRSAPPAALHADGLERDEVRPESRRTSSGVPALALTATAIGALGLLPTPALGGAAGAELHWRSWSAGIEGSFIAQPGKRTLGELRVAATRASLVAVPCLRLAWLSACLPIDVGVLDVRPDGDARPGRTVVADVGLRWVARWAFHPLLEARLWIQGSVAVVQPTIVINGEPAWTSAPVGGAAGLGIAVLP